jgi:hypothetical protein
MSRPLNKQYLVHTWKRNPEHSSISKYQDPKHKTETTPGQGVNQC